MPSHVNPPRPATFLALSLWLGLAFGLGFVIPRAHAAPAILVLDTGKPLSAQSAPPDRAGWTLVPSDLLALETDPPKASSDPGYYGREYHFHGDAVIENAHLTAVFWTSRGVVSLHAKDTPVPTSTLAPGQGPLGTRIAECSLLPDADAATATAPGSAIATLELLRNAADEVVVAVTFAEGTTKTASRKAPPPAPTVFAFGRGEIVEITPPKSARGLRLRTALDYGIVPGFIGDDLIFGPDQFEDVKTLRLPAENMLVGLADAGNRQLVLTWPKGRQQLRLQLEGASDQPRRFGAIDLETDGHGVFLATLGAPGVWHRHALSGKHLEADVKLAWKPPFPARWKTQLLEGDVKTGFAFRPARGQIWRGVPGSYSYPAWFEDGAAYLHPSKKVPPRGESLVYFLESQDTPAHFHAPVDLLKATLGRADAEAILDRAGRKLRTHHRRGGDGVRRACTCGCTEAIQAVFEAGAEVERRGFVKDALDDMIYFVARHVDRIQEYQKFAADLLAYSATTSKASPDLAPYLAALDEIAGLIPQECTVQKENMKSPEHAESLAERTLALTQRKDPSNMKAYLELLKAWRAMGGAQDYVVAQCHTITRKLSQEAAYTAATQTSPATLRVAEEIRRRCREILRNPDGYEIWAEY